MQIYTDSSAWVALFDKNDPFHETALKIRTEIQNSGATLLTTHVALSEALTQIARRVDSAYAASIGEIILSSPSVTIITPPPALNTLALSYLKPWCDLKVNFPDCLSLAWMKEYPNNPIFSFNKRFYLAGYHLLGIPRLPSPL